MSDALGYELIERLLLPLMSGGAVSLLPPIGGARARNCATLSTEPDQREAVRRFKLAAARRWYPVDELDALSPSEWLLLCALNDTLQLTHPDFSRPSDRSRLFALTREVIERAGAPGTVLEAFSRHALFSGLLELVRRDQEVSWWTGSRRFVGRRPPRRLLLWKTLRRVRTREETTRVAGLGVEPFEQLLEAWLWATPLTHLAAAALLAHFSWSPTALALVSEPSGRQLAFRVIVGSRDAHAVQGVLEKAIPQDDDGAGEVARGFSSELQRRLAQVG